MRGLLLTIIGVIVAAAAALYGVVSMGPSGEVMAAFQAYRAAYIAQSPEAVTKLTSDADISFWDEQRQLALTGKEETVRALDFIQRFSVMRLRADVLDGRFTTATLKSLDARQLYAATRDLKLYPKLLMDMELLFVVPTGSTTARGYLTLTKLPPAFPGHFEILALAQGLYLDFERQQDGRWLVDPTPLQTGSARANEQMAKMMDPTGNTYLMLSFNQANDPAREAKLWQPLAKE